MHALQAKILDPRLGHDVAVLHVMDPAERDLSLLFVTHNIALARHTATRIAVLNKGIIVDEGPVDEVLEHPTHDYTKALLANIPEL